MMAVFKTRLENGAIQIDQDMKNFTLIRKSEVYVNSWLFEFDLDNSTEYFAVRPANSENYIYINYATPSGSSNKVNIRLSDGNDYIYGNVIVYEFSSSPIGIKYKEPIRFNLYNSQGEITFSNMYKTLRVPYTFVSPNLSNNQQVIHTVDFYNRNESIDSSRVYAIASSSFRASFRQYKSDKFGFIELVSRAHNGLFSTLQKWHILGKSSSGYGQSTTTFGSPTIVHQLIDVTDY